MNSVKCRTPWSRPKMLRRFLRVTTCFRVSSYQTCLSKGSHQLILRGGLSTGLIRTHCWRHFCKKRSRSKDVRHEGPTRVEPSTSKRRYLCRFETEVFHNFFSLLYRIACVSEQPWPSLKNQADRMLASGVIGWCCSDLISPLRWYYSKATGTWPKPHAKLSFTRGLLKDWKTLLLDCAVQKYLQWFKAGMSQLSVTAWERLAIGASTLKETFWKYGEAARADQIASWRSRPSQAHIP